MSKGLFPALGGVINSVIWKTSPPTWVVRTLSGPGAELHCAFRGFHSLRPQVGRMVHLKGIKILQAGEPGLQHCCPALWRPSTSLQALLRQTPEEVSTSALFTYSNTRRGDLGFLVKLGSPVLHQECLSFSFLVCFSSNHLMLSNTTTVSRKLQGYSLTHPPKL